MSPLRYKADPQSCFPYGTDKDNECYQQVATVALRIQYGADNGRAGPQGEQERDYHASFSYEAQS